MPTHYRLHLFEIAKWIWRIFLEDEALVRIQLMKRVNDDFNGQP